MTEASASVCLILATALLIRILLEVGKTATDDHMETRNSTVCSPVHLQNRLPGTLRWSS